MLANSARLLLKIASSLRNPLPPLATALQSLNAHAKQRLDREKTAGMERSEKLELYRRFLKTEEHRIKLYHRSGASGMRVTKRRSDLLDVLLGHLYLDAVDAAEGAETEITLVAIGGYGRGRLNPCSDVDLLFLHPKGAAGMPQVASDFVESVLYMLYDCGFKVGHAVRSIAETIKEANTDDRTKSSIIEARLLFGDEKLYSELLSDFHRECIEGYERDYLKTRLEDIRLRHEKWRNTPFLQEPHVKEGCGALRDYHNMKWISFVRRGTPVLKPLVKAKLLGKRAYGEIRKAYEFLLRVRNELHYQQKRATDILTLRLQGEVAKALGYPQRTILKKIEAFMRDYYMHTNNLYLRAEELGDRFYLEEREADNKGAIVGFLARRKFKTEKFDGFIAKNNRIYFESPDVFKKEPDRLMRIFQHAQVRHLRLSPPLFGRIRKSWKLIDHAFRYRDSNRDTFEAILSRQGDVARALRLMHRAGILGKYLPEFDALTNLVQHEFFHRYTADEHTLRVADELDALATIDGSDRRKRLYRDLFNNVDDPFVLFLAILLHDSGRALNTSQHEDASATLAQRVSRRLSLKTKRRQLLLFLVNAHLELWRTANTQNIDDPNTIAEFAKIVGSRRNLDYLMLLTYADSRGTDEDSWTETKEAPLRLLYHETREFLADADGFTERRRVAQEALLEDVTAELPESYSSTVAAHFQEMPRRYFVRREAAHVARHVELIVEFFKNWAAADDPDPVLHWRELPDQGCSELTIVWLDRRRLLTHISGALAAHKVNILLADIFSRHDDIVVDVFRVCTTDFEPVTSSYTQRKIAETLRSGLHGDEIPYAKLIDKADDMLKDWQDLVESFPQCVYINNAADPDHTAIEIQALDRLGLLHTIVSAVGDLGHEITGARITTTRGAAIDTILVVDQDGQKLTDPAQLDELLSCVEAALGIEPGEA